MFMRCSLWHEDVQSFVSFVETRLDRVEWSFYLLDKDALWFYNFANGCYLYRRPLIKGRRQARFDQIVAL